MAHLLFDPQWIIARLRIQVAALKRVAGSAELAAASEDLKQVPAAFVIPNAERPGSSSTGTMVTSQQNSVRFGVVLAVSNLRDARGEKAQADLLTLRTAVMTALHGWQPNAEFDPLEYAGGRLLQLSDQVLWWQDDFSTTHLLRSV